MILALGILLVVALFILMIGGLAGYAGKQYEKQRGASSPEDQAVCVRCGKIRWAHRGLKQGHNFKEAS